jgi:addiction module HigA family antidote
MAKLLDEIHPGEILLEDFMKPMGLTARQLAADIDVPPSRISELVNGQRPITADTALRLGLFFDMVARPPSDFKRPQPQRRPQVLNYESSNRKRQAPLSHHRRRQ